jgi:hypothetical protein
MQLNSESLGYGWLLVRLVVKAYVLLLCIRLGLLLLSPTQRQRWIDRLGRKAGADGAVPWGWQQAVWSIEVATRYGPGRAKCLARAMAAQILLSRRGYKPVLRLGVMKSPSAPLQAHAWVELDEQTVIGHVDDLSSYTVLMPH